MSFWQNFSAESTARIERSSLRARSETFATMCRRPHTLPASWFDQGVQERMSSWIKMMKGPAA